MEGDRLFPPKFCYAFLQGAVAIAKLLSVHLNSIKGVELMVSLS
jgi:hypothetical protein